MRFKLALELHFFAGDLVEAKVLTTESDKITVALSHCASADTLSARAIHGHADPRPTSTQTITLEGQTHSEAIRRHLQRTLGVKVEAA